MQSTWYDLDLRYCENHGKTQGQATKINHMVIHREAAEDIGIGIHPKAEIPNNSKRDGDRPAKSCREGTCLWPSIQGLISLREIVAEGHLRADKGKRHHACSSDWITTNRPQRDIMLTCIEWRTDQNGENHDWKEKDGKGWPSSQGTDRSKYIEGEYLIRVRIRLTSVLQSHTMLSYVGVF